ncbi:MAG: hypothetical protein LBH06_01630 [Rikenellaceae bacterium]|jgi:uncharacterized membrane protein|nr:hypothetical protein [Rikenellaceae bacterium]
MPKKIVGVQMTREFNWSYICEQCGQKVEAQSIIGGPKHGVTVRKAELSGTQYSLTEVGKQTYLAQARAEFPRVCENFLADWNRGVYPDFVIAHKDKCPYCQKYQHWSKAIVNRKSPAGGIAVAIFVSPFLAALISLIIFFINTIFIKDQGIRQMTAFIVWILLTVIFIPAFIWSTKQEQKNILRQKAELESKPKQYPQFVSWGKTSETGRAWA